jgi:hypothetical protein
MCSNYKRLRQRFPSFMLRSELHVNTYHPGRNDLKTVVWDTFKIADDADIFLQFVVQTSIIKRRRTITRSIILLLVTYLTKRQEKH